MTASDGQLTASDDFRLTVAPIGAAMAATVERANGAIATAPLSGRATTTERDRPEAIAATAGEASVDRLLALMVQDMAGFGVAVGDLGAIGGRSETVKPLDFFA